MTKSYAASLVDIAHAYEADPTNITADNLASIIVATTFIPTKCITQKIFCIINNVYEIPKCEICKTPVKFDTVSGAYRTHCSISCKRVTAKRKMESKYGVAPMCKHCKNTTVPYNYGRSCYSAYCCRKCQKEYTTATIVANSGEAPKCEMCDNIVPFNYINGNEYGRFCGRACQIKSNTAIRYAARGNPPKCKMCNQYVKYNFSNQQYRTYCSTQCSKKDQQAIDANRKVTWLEKYGTDHINHRHIKPEVLSNLNSREWLHNEYCTTGKTSTTIANIAQCHQTTVLNYIHKHDIPISYNYSTSAGEREIADFLEYSGVCIIICDRQTIAPYELDIIITKHNIAIEYCGLYWHAEQQGKDKHYHKRKMDMCKSLGIQLVTIFEDEWIERKDQVKRKLLSMCNLSTQPTTFARNSTVATITTNEKTQFFENNHIQGAGPGSINIGLKADGNLIACMSFIKQQNQHYLNRYATACNVPGGFSKLLKHFKTTQDWNLLISFADLRWSGGNLYNKTGWTLDRVIPPDYYYSPDGCTRFHKFNYRRKYLPKLLKHFNPDLSEWENCKANNVWRIWDCGKLRFVMQNQSLQRGTTINTSNKKLITEN